MVPDAEVYIFFGLREDIKEDEKQMMHKAMQAATVRYLLRCNEHELRANPQCSPTCWTPADSAA